MHEEWKPGKNDSWHAKILQDEHCLKYLGLILGGETIRESDMIPIERGFADICVVEHLMQGNHCTMFSIAKGKDRTRTYL